MTVALFAACDGGSDVIPRADGGLPDTSMPDGSPDGSPNDAFVPQEMSTPTCASDFDCPPGLVCDGMAGVCVSSGPALCSVAECSAGFASTCEGDLSLDCNAFGGSCADFTTPDGASFQWCDCGPLADGEATCIAGNLGVVCDQSVLGQVFECVPGTLCLDASDGVPDTGCYCDDIEDGVCPDPGCTLDPDCSVCTPNCDGVSCGDNGCGASCGSCGLGETCSGGRCVSSCTPRCDGRSCGDNGCGGSCGSCRSDESCVAGSCVGECTPDCSGRVCGSNGCGGTCGSCRGGESCNDDGRCVSDCVPSCDGRTCGSNGCGGSCGSCRSGESCESGTCVGSSCGSGGPCDAPAVCSAISSGGERCSCLDLEQTYDFDGTGLDFSGSLRSARIRVRQIYDNDTSPVRTRDSVNFRSESTQLFRFLAGCSANVEITRVFSFVLDGRSETCEVGPETYIGQTSFTLTMPSGEGSSCSAGRL